MATKYEYLSTGDDNKAYSSAIRYDAQTFTVGGTAHTVTSVKIKMYRDAGYSTTTTMAIYGVDGSDLPDDGNVLATSDAVAAALITTDSAGDWVEFTFSSPPELSASTVYAVVLIPTASYVYWLYDNNSNAYVDGTLALRNAGTWVEAPNDDGMFEVWGNPVAQEYTEGTKTVTVAASIELASENYVDNQGAVPDRPTEYDGDKYWDEDTGTWVTTRTTHPGNWAQNLLVVSEEGDIYFRTI